MSWDQAGADYATMATGISAVTAAFVWVRGQWREQRERRAEVKARNWSAYIEPTGINDWFVRAVDDGPMQDARVTLQVVTVDGRPDEQMAGGFLRVVERDGRLACAPTQEQMTFLVAMRKERFGKGYPVR
jgi:hypothetical protein